MRLSFSSVAAARLRVDTVIYFMFEDSDLFEAQRQQITEQFPGIDHVFTTGDFTGKKNTSLQAYNNDGNIRRIILSGLGESDNFSLHSIRMASATASKYLSNYKVKSPAVHLAHLGNFSAAQIAQSIIEGMELSLYKFDNYFSDKDDKRFVLDKLTFFCDDKKWLAAGKEGAQIGIDVAGGVNEARDLGNAPANEIYPETLAKRAMQLGKEFGFKVTVLDKRKITSAKMAGLLAVNQGSVKPPTFIIMEYKGGKAGEKPVVLVGKGVTFDTGGISLKPGAGMSDMKTDMHGSATVIGTMRAVAAAKLPINLVGLVPATDNMPSGSAILPGDIITYSNGISVEIDNTDAEGRLILADALIYAAKYKPQAVIDLATLTGACMIALGHYTSGMMGTSRELLGRIGEAGKRTREHVCELPLHEEYEEQLKSNVADLVNVGGRPAGAITAGLFLKRFAGDLPWVHMDIAGTGILPKATALNPRGASGVGVRLLFDMLANW